MEMNTQAQALQTENDSDEVVKLKPQFDLSVSSDKMAAFIKVTLTEREQVVEYEDILNVLSENKIVYGIKHDMIKAFCESRSYYSNLIVAQGSDPQDGENGYVEFHFKTDTDLKPTEKEDGTVDYYNLGVVQNVTQGQVLCTLIPPKDGVNGVDIYNNQIMFTKGTPAKLPQGKNTEITEDGNELISSIDGCIEYTNSVVNINDIFSVKGDVDNSVGNIDCSGTVVIYGDVREGFTVTAKKDVVVKGMVEGAIINAGGNVTISNGMNGRNKGIINAGGKVVSKFFENSKVKADDDVQADVIMNSEIISAKSVILKGKKAALIGGTCQAGEYIYASYIGTYNFIPTNVIITNNTLFDLLSESTNNSESNKQLEEKIIQNKIAENQANLEKLNATLANMSGKVNPTQARALLKGIIAKKSELTNNLLELNSKLEKLQNESKLMIKSVENYKIIAVKSIFPGVKITIGNLIHNIREQHDNSKFYINNREIIFTLVTPADKK